MAYREDLQDPEVLNRETIRMMNDPKFRRFSDTFAPQWLGVTDFLYAPMTDETLFPELTEGLRKAMYYEVVGFFDEVMNRRRNLLLLLDSDFAYMNGDLSRFYGVGDLDGDDFQIVPLADRRRGGVMGMAAVLTATSLPTRTSPVLRGQWVLNQVLGTPAPPPPPDTPELEDSKGAVKNELDLRALLEYHRSDVACRSCHQKMDPIGLGLENYDAIGRWRETYDTLTIDASGTLDGGQSFAGPIELKELLLDEKQKFARNISRKFLSFALGRNVEFLDSRSLDQLTSALLESDFDSHALILALVNSYPFKYRRSDLASRYLDI